MGSVKKFRIFLWLAFLSGWSSAGLRAQEPPLPMVPPLDLPPALSATFGELRPSHFHSGIDLKTGGRTGHKVRSIARGYVYRIKVQRGGYGKAVYIKHPGGLISVYAHLEKLAGPLQAYLKRQQYQKQSFFLDIYPPRDSLPVEGGQVIGYSGNTGSSSGPHLHFEIREGEGHPVNPMRYGFTATDTIAPVLRGLFAYATDDTSAVNGGRGRIPLLFKKTGPRQYRADPVEGYGGVSFGIDAYDQANNTWNKNGIYRTEVWVNGLKIYETVMDKISFATTRHINVFIDYPYYVAKRRYIQRLWRHPEARLPVYALLVNRGIIRVEPGKTYKVKIRLSDFEGNAAEIIIPLSGKKFDSLPPPRSRVTPHLVRFRRPYRIRGLRTTVDFPAQALFEDTYVDLQEFVNGFALLPADMPMRKSVRIAFSMENIPPAKKKYAYLARVNPRNKKAYFASARKRQDSLIVVTRNPGTYMVKYDSIPPVIDRLNISDGKWISNYRYLRFRVRDNIGVRDVRAYIDGKWILVEWDYKTGKAFYDFSDLRFPGTKHELKIVVTDRTGNRTEKRLIFYRKFSR